MCDMREILFKAKRIDNGEWVEGLLTIMWGQYHIINPSDENTAYPIDVDTICQFTGLTDKNGKKIWENDIIFVTDDDGNSGQIDTGVGEIDFLEGLWYISGKVQNSLYDINKCFQIEVIGNIFDNHELMKGK